VPDVTVNVDENVLFPDSVNSPEPPFVIAYVTAPAKMHEIVAEPVTAMELPALGVSVKAPPIEEPAPIDFIVLQALAAVSTG
jgi:hypothetical protein